MVVRDGRGARPSGAPEPDPSAEPAPPQRRRWRRLPVKLWTEGRVDGRLDFHNCANLGIGGMFIETSPPYPVGKRVQIEFSLPGTFESIKVTGQVVSVVLTRTPDGRRPGNGFEFLDLTPRARALVERFIEMYWPS